MVELVKRYYMISIISVIVIVFIFFNILSTNSNDDIQLIVNSEKQEDTSIDKANDLSDNIPTDYPSGAINNAEAQNQLDDHNVNKVLNNAEGLNLSSYETNNYRQSNTRSNPMDSIQEPSIIPVYICGEINKPGVYEVESNELINDIVNLAGGFTQDADIRAINLASKISSNEMIIVPKIGEEVEQLQISSNDIEEDITESVNYMNNNSAEYNIDSNNETNLVNINTANRTLLMSLPGIGEVKADAIIEYRESVGGFSSIGDIKNVSGIGEKTFEKLTKLITI